VSGRSGSLAHVLNALRRVSGLEVAECSSIPPQCIAVGDEVVAFIDDLDAWQSASPAGTEPVLVTCVVSPGFEFADFELA